MTTHAIDDENELVRSLKAVMPPWLGIDEGRASDVGDARLADLYGFANQMAAEDFEHFVRHLRTNHVIHQFIDVRTKKLVGFQAWRSEPFDEGRRLIIGGKLRVLPAYRRRALHLLSGLRFFATEQARYPDATFDRVSIANVFGFATLARQLACYTIIAPRATLEGIDQVRFDKIAQFVADSGYVLDASSGLVRVGIRMTPAQLSAYPDAFYESHVVQTYLQRVPDAFESDRQVAFWFSFDKSNVDALLSGCRERLSRPPPEPVVNDRAFFP